MRLLLDHVSVWLMSRLKIQNTATNKHRQTNPEKQQLKKKAAGGSWSSFHGQLVKFLTSASLPLLQKLQESLSWTDPCGLFHWAKPHQTKAGITDSVLLLPLAMPSYLIHRQLLSWQQCQLGDTGSIIVTLVPSRQTHTHIHAWEGLDTQRTVLFCATKVSPSIQCCWSIYTTSVES